MIKSAASAKVFSGGLGVKNNLALNKLIQT
jgi:hypothetical protein